MLHTAACGESRDYLHALRCRGNASWARVLRQFLQLSRRDPLGVNGEVSVIVGAERLENVDLRLERMAGLGKRHEGWVLEMLGTNADDHAPATAAIARHKAPPQCVCNLQVSDRRAQAASVELSGQEVHRGRADEAGHEEVVRRL